MRVQEHLNPIFEPACSHAVPQMFLTPPPIPPLNYAPHTSDVHDTCPSAAGAPQNHWFGPAGDPRAAGIGTPEAIRLVWSCHREIINDVGPVPEGFPLKQS